MAESFQPQDPHPDSKSDTGWTSIAVAAVLSAFGVFMIFALLAPRMEWTDGVSWGLTLGATVLVLLVVLGGGLMRSRQA